ncbi:MAG: response regulator transcription factor [Gammaproteobacteria bacterium]|nr:response regulator transcription factor [Gammaproteobacteria bacterium]
MALIWLFGTDLARLSQWSATLDAAGHDHGILPLSALAASAKVSADLCLFDLGPRGDAEQSVLRDAVKAHGSSRFIALSARPHATEGLALLRAGVRGYANRLAAGKVIQAVVDAVLADEVWAGREVTEHLLQQALATPVAEIPEGEQLLAALTPREAEVALAVATGHSNKVIALDSGVSERTIKAQLNSIFRKTGVRNRVQLALALSHLQPNPAGHRISNA